MDREFLPKSRSTSPGIITRPRPFVSDAPFVIIVIAVILLPSSAPTGSLLHTLSNGKWRPRKFVATTRMQKSSVLKGRQFLHHRGSILAEFSAKEGKLARPPFRLLAQTSLSYLGHRCRRRRRRSRSSFLHPDLHLSGNLSFHPAIPDRQSAVNFPWKKTSTINVDTAQKTKELENHPKDIPPFNHSAAEDRIDSPRQPHRCFQ